MLDDRAWLVMKEVNSVPCRTKTELIRCDTGSRQRQGHRVLVRPGQYRVAVTTGTGANDRHEPEVNFCTHGQDVA
jgi:hypothetical protein